LNSLKNRVRVMDDRIVYVRELEVPTPEGVSESAQYIRELSREWDHFDIIVEFPTMVIPDAAVRHRVAEEVLPLKTKLQHVAVVTKSNVFMTLTIKFIGVFAGFHSISVHQTKQLALEELRRKRQPFS